MESELIEKYHWLPQEIDQIPYKRLQEHRFIQGQKDTQIDIKKKTAEASNKAKQGAGVGGVKKFTREI
jgi:hypothetical protein